MGPGRAGPDPEEEMVGGLIGVWFAVAIVLVLLELAIVAGIVGVNAFILLVLAVLAKA